jgi:hypothetical protein
LCDSRSAAKDVRLRATVAQHHSCAARVCAVIACLQVTKLVGSLAGRATLTQPSPAASGAQVGSAY